jgi:hypothetical protein
LPCSRVISARRTIPRVAETILRIFPFLFTVLFLEDPKLDETEADRFIFRLRFDIFDIINGDFDDLDIESRVGDRLRSIDIAFWRRFGDTRISGLGSDPSLFCQASFLLRGILGSAAVADDPSMLSEAVMELTKFAEETPLSTGIFDNFLGW